MQRKKLVIGIFGLGTVGNGLYEILTRSNLFHAEVKKICVKDKSKLRSIPIELLSFDKREILDDDNINVIVELIDDAEEAFCIVKEAMQKGKAVVSANKKMIAQHLEALIALQVQNKCPFLYEAACCASVPIIRNLEEYYDTDSLESIDGIINGSTNYMLTKMQNLQQDYQTTLTEAQIAGYAESNPAMDVEGYDARFKLQILALHAFGLILHQDDIFQFGINTLHSIDFEYARSKSLKIKLIAHADKSSDGECLAYVMPSFVAETDRFFWVDDVFNMILTKTRFSDSQVFIGKGAGAYPTASALISDLSAISYEYKYEYKKWNSYQGRKINKNSFLNLYCSASGKILDVCKDYFDEIDEHLSTKDQAYIKGKISYQNLKQMQVEVEGQFSVILLAA